MGDQHHKNSNRRRFGRRTKLAPARAALPRGYENQACPKCGGGLEGAIITSTADEQDPNILCRDQNCGWWSGIEY